jgi:hypothetical protein
MDPLDVVKLTALLQITRGRPEIVIGLLDGPVALDHPDLLAQHIRELPTRRGMRAQANHAASMHGTFVAGMLCAKRGAAAPAICPDCTLLVRPIFGDTIRRLGGVPSHDAGLSEVNGVKQEEARGDHGDNSEHQPHRVRLSGFITDEDIGLGDVIKRVTYAVGIKPCGGCERRAAALNRWLVFSGRRLT